MTTTLLLTTAGRCGYCRARLLSVDPGQPTATAAGNGDGLPVAVCVTPACPLEGREAIAAGLEARTVQTGRPA